MTIRSEVGYRLAIGWPALQAAPLLHRSNLADLADLFPRAHTRAHVCVMRNIGLPGSPGLTDVGAARAREQSSERKV